MGLGPRRSGWKEDEFRLWVNELREALMPRFLEMGWETPHAQDIQNCLCEWDKYERARLGEGRPKQLFRPKAQETRVLVEEGE